ncbi:MAG: hypothetical protein M1836_002350 [Candelina mexicana]|nr:MAG: hypothetical protein M1836_002350 [Candelina mexicana]
MSSQILSDRDVNSSGPQANTQNSTSADHKPKSMDYHRQVLQSRLNGDDKQQTYISPSDNIMSPCTQKLSVMKNKHFTKAKPQTLFGKQTLSNSPSTDSTNSSPFTHGDIKQGDGQ